MEIDSLLAPIEGEAPSGIELRNDGRFLAIERLLDPADKAARLKRDGTIDDAAPRVAWDEVMAQGVALSAEGRDLRLLVILVRATYAAEGFEGLAQGLEMLARTLTDYWDSLHPALRDRPDPRAAVMPRSNALRQLESDRNGLLGDLRFGYVLSPRGIGPISGDDLAQASLSEFEMLARAASGLGQKEKEALVARHEQRLGRVTAAVRALAAEEAERAESMIAALAACERAVGALCEAFDHSAGLEPGQGLSMPELAEFFGRCSAVLASGRAEAAGPPQETAAPVASGGNGAQPPGAPSKAGEIRSRADVETALDRIVEFYERTEPSSPIPHLARRMRRMVSMDFLELMEEVAPSGLKEFRNIAGVGEGKGK